MNNTDPFMLTRKGEFDTVSHVRMSSDTRNLVRPNAQRHTKNIGKVLKEPCFLLRIEHCFTYLSELHVWCESLA